MNAVKKYLNIALVGIAVALLGSVMAGDVVITEVMYHPASDSVGDEFIELFNVGAGPVDITGWCFDGILFCFPATTTITPGQYLVLAADATAFQSTYGGSADHVYQLELNDNGERLALIDVGLVVQDEVIYTDEPPWPVTPDGLGPSLEVVDPEEDNATPQNWRASEDAQDATPGAINSVDAAGLPPWIEDVLHTQNAQAGNDIIVTASVEAATDVDLFYVIEFGTEAPLEMLDDGLSNDGAEDDLVYGAAIPGQAAGTLVRYRIAASGATGSASHPRVDDTATYDGTVVDDPTVSTNLPVLNWFIRESDYQDATTHPQLLTDETEQAPQLCPSLF